MAARDRFGGFSEAATTPLQRYIQNACDPQNFEPNLALNLEITDMINQKKGTAPREAAIAIVTHVNNRNANISLLALTLLDYCVKNCGYPFHLQISTKEFLNELVRRFPERPPIRYSRTQARVLELIEDWRQTICQTSKYREDLGFIRDMHRLLAYKGYTFPAVKREDAAVLNQSEHLQSAEEMEEEERAAQSAKLQELIRRGTPHDLQEANKLMKVMAGFDTRQKTDYRAKAAEEVSKVQQKAKLLEDMLQEYSPGDSSINSDAFEELANALVSASPKIQKMCEEESDDHEAVAKLFEINDSIHRTLERYRLTKKGDVAGAAKIPPGTLGTSGAGVSKGPGNELSLIDLGGPEDAAPAQAASAQPQQQSPGASLENDLLGLSLGDTNGSAGGQISLGGVGGLGTMSMGGPTTLPTSTQPAPQQPNYAGFNNADLLGSISGPSSAQPPAGPAHQRTTSQAQSPDPFAALSGSSNARTSSPFQFQQSLGSPGQSSTPTAQAQARAPPPPASGAAAADDEWQFSSALPDSKHELVVHNAAIHIAFVVSRPAEAPEQLLVQSSISNNTPQPVADFTFQLAVTKSLQLRLEPQSGRALAPLQRAGISQRIRVVSSAANSRVDAAGVRVRWKASYRLGGATREEQGELAGLGPV